MEKITWNKPRQGEFTGAAMTGEQQKKLTEINRVAITFFQWSLSWNTIQ